MKLTKFELSYIETALWSSIDLDDTEPMDLRFGVEDFAPETLELIRKDCEKFLELIEGIEVKASEIQLAHDFWLTRNGHGAGFWDGDYPEEIGRKLTEISKQFGEIVLYSGDDNFLYFL